MLLIEGFQQTCCRFVVGLAVEGKAQVVGDVIMTGIDQRVLGQGVQLSHKGLVELFRVAAAVTVAGASIEQGVTAEKRRHIGLRQQAHVAHGVSGRVHGKEFHRTAHLNHITGIQAHIHVVDLVLGVLVRDERSPGGRHHGPVAPGMVAMLVSVEDLGDLPAIGLGPSQALLVIQRVYGHGFAAFRTDDEIVEISIGVTRPDLLYNHCLVPVVVVQNSGPSLPRLHATIGQAQFFRRGRCPIPNHATK